MIVQKFGGSSVANAEKLQRVAERIVAAAQAANRVVVVVSAMGDTTDELIKLAESISPQPPEREMDMLVSCGEQISSALLAMAVSRRGPAAISFTGAQVGIITDSYHTQAKILRRPQLPNCFTKCPHSLLLYRLFSVSQH